MSSGRNQVIFIRLKKAFVRDNDYYEAEGVLDDYCKWEDSVIESAMDPITYEEELEIILDGMAHKQGETIVYFSGYLTLLRERFFIDILY